MVKEAASENRHWASEPDGRVERGRPGKRTNTEDKDKDKLHVGHAKVCVGRELAGGQGTSLVVAGYGSGLFATLCH